MPATHRIRQLIFHICSVSLVSPNYYQLYLHINTYRYLGLIFERYVLCGNDSYYGLLRARPKVERVLAEMRIFSA